MTVHMPTKSLSSVFRAYLLRIRAHGDVVFILALLCSIGYAAFIFYRFIYPPIFIPQEVLLRRAVFNTALYNTVIEGVELRNRASAEALVCEVLFL